MSETLVAKRYAEALYELGSATGTLKDVDEDVAALSETIDGSRELANFLRSPIISREKKGRTVKSLFAGRLTETTLRFLDLLVVKRREDIVRPILAAYRDLRDGQLGIAGALARSAQPLSEADGEHVRVSLERITGRKIRLTTEADRRLIGGLIVRIGDTVYDGSVRHKLDHLRNQFVVGSGRVR